MHLEETMKKRDHTMAKKAKKDTVETAHGLEEALVFNGMMRKMLVKGVLQDIKGYIELKTDGKVEVQYEEPSLKGHEFCFKLVVSKGKTCTKQMYSEASSAVANAVSYAFPGDSEQYDVALTSDGSRLEVDIVSNW